MLTVLLRTLRKVSLPDTQMLAVRFFYPSTWDHSSPFWPPSPATSVTPMPIPGATQGSVACAQVCISMISSGGQACSTSKQALWGNCTSHCGLPREQEPCHCATHDASEVSWTSTHGRKCQGHSRPCVPSQSVSGETRRAQNCRVVSITGSQSKDGVCEILILIARLCDHRSPSRPAPSKPYLHVQRPVAVPGTLFRTCKEDEK